MPEIPEPDAGLRVGRLTKAHGLKGALKVELYTDEPERRFAPGASFMLQVPADSPWSGSTVELDELRWYNGHPVAFFRGVSDRTAAETLVRAILWVDDDTEAASADEDDAWPQQRLVGLRVERDGETVGTVARVEQFPAQDMLIVETPAGDVLVPFVSAIVPIVEPEQGRIVVTPPAGLFGEPLEDDAPATDRDADRG